MQTLTKRRRGNRAFGAGCALDADPARDGEAGRVLIVDDAAPVRLVCAANLEAEGLHVLEAADGLDALEQARRERPDLVLTDVTMPGLDGFQLAERLRRDERTHGMPVIFSSGEVGPANEERAGALGAVAFDKAVRPACTRPIPRARTGRGASGSLCAHGHGRGLALRSSDKRPR